MAYMLETVARITGASVKQLIHWDQSGLVRPSLVPAQGKGSRRIYSFLDMLAIKTTVALRREGISLQKIRRCLEYLHKHRPRVEHPLTDSHLITDGQSVFVLCDEPSQAWQRRKVVDTLAGGQMMLLVPIGRMARETHREVSRLQLAPEKIRSMKKKKLANRRKVAI